MLLSLFVFHSLCFARQLKVTGETKMEENSMRAARDVTALKDELNALKIANDTTNTQLQHMHREKLNLEHALNSTQLKLKEVGCIFLFGCPWTFLLLNASSNVGAFSSLKPGAKQQQRSNASVGD